MSKRGIVKIECEQIMRMLSKLKEHDFREFIDTYKQDRSYQYKLICLITKNMNSKRLNLEETKDLVKSLSGDCKKITVKGSIEYIKFYRGGILAEIMLKVANGSYDLYFRKEELYQKIIHYRVEDLIEIKGTLYIDSVNHYIEVEEIIDNKQEGEKDARICRD